MPLSVEPMVISHIGKYIPFDWVDGFMTAGLVQFYRPEIRQQTLC